VRPLRRYPQRVTPHIMDKQSIIQAIAALLQEEIARAVESANRTREGAIHEEARPENDKDTRALEASYLARGQAQRVVELERACKRILFMETRPFSGDDPIDISALILLEGEEGSRWYFLAPAGGGRTVECAGVSIDVITPEAPLGRALVGRQRGDDLDLRLNNRLRSLSITELR
jgi:hypothetical protein